MRLKDSMILVPFALAIGFGVAVLWCLHCEQAPTGRYLDAEGNVRDRGSHAIIIHHELIDGIEQALNDGVEPGSYEPADGQAQQNR